MTTSTLSSAPELINQSALLADYLDPNLSLLDLSERHNLSLSDLIAWSELPATATLLSRLKAFADQRAAILAADHSPAAVASLSAIAHAALTTSSEAPDPALRLRAIESARRAASQILRLTPRLRTRAQAAQDKAPGCDGSSGSAPSRAQAPECPPGEPGSDPAPAHLGTSEPALDPPHFFASRLSPPLDLPELVTAGP